MINNTSNNPNNPNEITNNGPNGHQQTTQIGTGQNIVVNVGQQQLRGPIVDPTRLWSTDMCDCCMDCGTCKHLQLMGGYFRKPYRSSSYFIGAMSWFCPCVQVGMNATKVSKCSSPHLEGCCCGFWYCMLWLMCLGYFFGCGLRVRIRERNRIYGYALFYSLFGKYPLILLTVIHAEIVARTFGVLFVPSPKREESLNIEQRR